MGSISRRHALGTAGAAGALSLNGVWAPPALAQATAATAGTGKLQSWKQATQRRTGIHELAPAPDGGVWWCSLAGSFIARVDRRMGESTAVEPPTPGQVWLPESGTVHVSVIYTS